MKFELPRSSQHGFTQLPLDHFNFSVNNYFIPQANKQTIKSRGQYILGGKLLFLIAKMKESDLSTVGPKNMYTHNFNIYPIYTMSYIQSDSSFLKGI